MLSSPFALFFKATNKFFPSQLRIWDEKKDRISELPQDIIDCIFHLLGARDVARARILSRKWCHICSSYPQLVFDDNFFNKIYEKHKQSICSEYPKAMNNALFFRGGPIYKFILHVPKILDDLSPEIDQCMLFLSRNDIRELELKCLNPKPYTVPSCIFLCRSLVHLELHNCILKPPHEFEGFRLVSLNLVRVSVYEGFSETILKSAPFLEKLVINCCSGIEHTSIYAPRLNRFCIIKSGKVDWEWFASNKKLSYVQIYLGAEVQNVEQNVTMMKFLKDIPNLTKLVLDGFSLKYLATSNSREVLIPSAPSLTTIVITDFRVDDPDQISSALCLLKNSPNLLYLDLRIAASVSNKDDLEQIAVKLSNYKLSNCKDLRLDKLQTVWINSMKGVKAELLLIKLILGCASSLWHMVIIEEESSGIIGYFVSREIRLLYRASPQARIYYKAAKNSTTYTVDGYGVNYFINVL